jgi:hypothetical protein
MFEVYVVALLRRANLCPDVLKIQLPAFLPNGRRRILPGA